MQCLSLLLSGTGKLFQAHTPRKWGVSATCSKVINFYGNCGLGVEIGQIIFLPLMVLKCLSQPPTCLLLAIPLVPEPSLGVLSPYIHHPPPRPTL